MCFVLFLLLCLKLSFFICVTSPEQARLCELEDQAKSSKKGLWSEGGGTHTIRDIKYTIENPRNFVDSLHQKPINGNGCGKGYAQRHTHTDKAWLRKHRHMPYKNTYNIT